VRAAKIVLWDGKEKVRYTPHHWHTRTPVRLTFACPPYPEVRPASEWALASLALLAWWLAHGTEISGPERFACRSSLAVIGRRRDKEQAVHLGAV